VRHRVVRREERDAEDLLGRDELLVAYRLLGGLEPGLDGASVCRRAPLAPGRIRAGELEPARGLLEFAGGLEGLSLGEHVGTRLAAAREGRRRDGEEQR